MRSSYHHVFLTCCILAAVRFVQGFDYDSLHVIATYNGTLPTAFQERVVFQDNLMNEEAVRVFNELPVLEVNDTLLASNVRRLQTSDWEVKIVFKTNGVSAGCSGFFISPGVIMTAAHCIFENGYTSTNMEVILVSGGNANGPRIRIHSAKIPLAWNNKYSDDCDFAFASLQATVSLTGGYYYARCDKDVVNIMGFPSNEYSIRRSPTTLLNGIDNNLFIFDGRAVLGGMSGGVMKSRGVDSLACGDVTRGGANSGRGVNLHKMVDRDYVNLVIRH